MLQALLSQLDAAPRYWTNEKPKHEVDFLIQVGNEIVPVEVKNRESRSFQALSTMPQACGDDSIEGPLLTKNLKLDDGCSTFRCIWLDRSVPLIKKRRLIGAS